MNLDPDGLNRRDLVKGAALGGAAVLGATGYALGAISEHIHRERWERVPLPSRVSVSASPNGTFALSYSF